MIAVVDRHEDPEGRADLTRADDEVSTNDGSQEFFLPTSVVPAVVFFSHFFVPVNVFGSFSVSFFFVSFVVNVTGASCFFHFAFCPCSCVWQFFLLNA